MSRRAAAAVAAVALLATVAAPVAPAATQGRSFVVYAKPTRAQFINRADDRQRGKVQNPFGSDLLPTPPSANTGKKGARAGDRALFSLRLYSDAKLTRFIGTASYSCTFNFAHEAICDGDFDLIGGTLIAMGPADLDSGHFVLPVTAGTGRYSGAHGQLTSRSTGGKTNTEIIRFRLV